MRLIPTRKRGDPPALSSLDRSSFFERKEGFSEAKAKWIMNFNFMAVNVKTGLLHEVTVPIDTMNIEYSKEHVDKMEFYQCTAMAERVLDAFDEMHPGHGIVSMVQNPFSTRGDALLMASGKPGHVLSPFHTAAFIDVAGSTIMVQRSPDGQVHVETYPGGRVDLDAVACCTAMPDAIAEALTSADDAQAIQDELAMRM